MHNKAIGIYRIDGNTDKITLNTLGIADILLENKEIESAVKILTKCYNKYHDGIIPKRHYPIWSKIYFEQEQYDSSKYYANRYVNESNIKDDDAKVIYLTPQGKVLNQQKVEKLSKEKHLILLCGHYEGIDQRVIDKIVDEEISIGDYVLTGGEIPAMVLIDSVSRYVEGVLSEDSTSEESFSQGILEYPQYTRPETFEDEKVPEILLSGHHENINKWRRCQALKNTYLKRPELLENVELSEQDRKYLNEIKN